jgi:hypothetical protein
MLKHDAAPGMDGLTWQTYAADLEQNLTDLHAPVHRSVSTGTAAGVRKPPRDETAGRGTYWAVPRAQLWGFGSGRATAEVGEAVG